MKLECHGSQPILKLLELVAFSPLPYLPLAPCTLLKGPLADKQLHLFCMALVLTRTWADMQMAYTAAALQVVNILIITLT